MPLLLWMLGLPPYVQRFGYIAITRIRSMSRTFALPISSRSVTKLSSSERAVKDRRELVGSCFRWVQVFIG